MDSSTSTWVNTCLGLNLFPAVDSPHAIMERDDERRPPLELVTNNVKDRFEGENDLFESNLQTLKQEGEVGGSGGTVEMAEELNRISLENKRLVEMLTVLCKNYNNLETHVKQLMPSANELMLTVLCKNYNNLETHVKQLMPSANELMISGNTCNLVKKRKSPPGNDHHDDNESYKRPKQEMSSTNINLRISRVYVRCDASDTCLIVKDGYQWRKYGQKVTRDNPSPRAYYRCSFAPSCPVKKKVQKSAENPCLLVATYEGEHNHIRPAGSHVITIDHKAPPKISSPSSSSPMSSSSCVLDCLSEPKPNQGRESQEMRATDFKQLLVHQMASSLTKDSKFTTALAAAISAQRFTQQPHPPIPKW